LNRRTINRRKLNHAIRFGNYNKDLFKKFCGKDVDALWLEFLEAYQADPANILNTPVAAADKQRILPVVEAGTSTPIVLTAAFNTVGVTRDGATFFATKGFNSGGASYSATLLGEVQTWKNEQFRLGAAARANAVSCRSNVLALPAASLLLCGCLVPPLKATKRRKALSSLTPMAARNN
jgi:hypothetical protein